MVDDRSYTYASGTSMAVPHVAGERAGCTLCWRAAHCWVVLQAEPAQAVAEGRAGRWPCRCIHGVNLHTRCADSSCPCTYALAAGVAAVYLSANPGATPQQVASLITSTATPNNVVSARFKPGTPNRLLYSRLDQQPEVQAANGPRP